MLRWLPPDAALWRSQGSAWGMETELLAVQTEILDALLTSYARVHSKKGSSPKKDPLRIPRPWDRAADERSRQGTTLGELLAKSGMRIIRAE